MDKIKEKPQTVSGIREKVKAAPKELAHRGLEDGTNRLRTGLRDAAQQGRQDDYGGDRIEDTAAGGMRRMERGAEKLIKEKRKSRAGRGDSSSDSTTAEGMHSETLSDKSNGKADTAAMRNSAGRSGEAGQRIKTKGSYMRAQA